MCSLYIYSYIYYRYFLVWYSTSSQFQMIKDGICKLGAELLQVELANRFGHYLDPNMANFDPVFVVATALDPRYKRFMTEEHLQSAKASLLSQVIYSFLF